MMPHFSFYIHACLAVTFSFFCEARCHLTSLKDHLIFGCRRFGAVGEEDEQLFLYLEDYSAFEMPN